jgi:hypothetical protein
MKDAEKNLNGFRHGGIKRENLALPRPVECSMPPIRKMKKERSVIDHYTTMGLKYFVCVVALSGLFMGCATIQAYKDLNTTPDNLLRGDPSNTTRAKEYLLAVLSSLEEYEVKAYNRKPYSVNTKKNLFMVHSFYVFFKNGKMEHTLVFTGTPKGSEQNGCWMLDALPDVDSYNLLMSSDNPWEVEEYQGLHGETTLNILQTTQKILTRLDKGYIFFGGAIVRDLAWYHQLWMFLTPPPILLYGPLLLISIHADNCASAVLETMVWEQR